MAKRFVIYIDGEEIEVAEDVYTAYKHSVWNENKRRRYRIKTERSLEKYIEDGIDFASDDMVEEIVNDQILLETLFMALNALTDEERSLIDALYFQDMTEREAAAAAGLSAVAIHRWKRRILKKMREIFG
ncbi:sigma-70 family RNA polymerase sigma factor [Eubacteriales bacterium OttesenSCG-928-A19]|nr:sigma-70 family RNA polymerase sigma factor [Eubacteriales bacterium OttesenSCG-928-A19]